MDYYVAMLVFGIILLLLGLLGKVKAKELEVGTSSTIVRVITTLLGSGLIISSFIFNPDVRYNEGGAQEQTTAEGHANESEIAAAEQERLERERQAEAERTAEEERARIAEEERLAEERRRIEEEKARLEEERRRAEEHERERLEEERRRAEEQRRAAREEFINRECGGRIVSVPSQAIATGKSNASLGAGDSEINSDDWTSVKLSYSTSQSSNRIVLKLTWHAQERNRDRSWGDTRIDSSKTFTVFSLKNNCPLKIKEVTGLVTNASKEEFYRGEIHGFRTFPNTGSLQEIQVRVDASGRRDNEIQALKATLGGFTVRLGE